MRANGSSTQALTHAGDYSAVWLAAGARLLGGRVLEEWAELVEGDAFESLARIDDTFDVVFIDAEKDG